MEADGPWARGGWRGIAVQRRITMPTLFVALDLSQFCDKEENWKNMVWCMRTDANMDANLIFLNL